MERPTVYHELGIARLKDKAAEGIGSLLKRVINLGIDWELGPAEDQYDDPLATPLEPVTSLPEQGILQGMNQMVFPDEAA